jgi:hypothetical protein
MTHPELMIDIWSVGCVDFEVRKFHGYNIHEGSSYTFQDRLI